uniref:Uncharacterized protein n=1 Tax=Arundo donax TaxID=35708 RepID=A0A0A9B006_ARUDO
MSKLFRLCFQQCSHLNVHQRFILPY